MKQARLAQPNTGKTRTDFVTLDASRTRPVFMCWREGARMPNSFHLDEEDAYAIAAKRVRLGESMCVLRAEITTVFSAPVVHRVDRSANTEA